MAERNMYVGGSGNIIIDISGYYGSVISYGDDKIAKTHKPSTLKLQFIQFVSTNVLLFRVSCFGGLWKKENY